MDNTDFIEVIEEIKKVLLPAVEIDPETSKCPDITAGFVINGELISWFSGEERLRTNENDPEKLKISEPFNGKTIAVILESPHTAEFTDDLINPAIGKTGDNLCHGFKETLPYLRLKNEMDYRIILMNTIQYQCSLGLNTKQLRDRVWIKLWFDYEKRYDFINRLKTYNPDIIVNLCTKGNHTRESSVINSENRRCKTVINKKYLDCVLESVPGDLDSKVTLKSLVTKEILSFYSENIFEGPHPSSWKGINYIQFKAVVI